MLFRKKYCTPQVEDIKEVIQDEEIPSVTEKEEAPLFVKVEKYQSVLSDIAEIKAFISSMKNLFNVFQELENVRQDSLKMLRATIQRLEKSVIEIDSELLRPKGIVSAGSDNIQHIEDSLTELQKQLGMLKSELESIR